MRKVIPVIFILLLLVGIAYAGDATKEDKDVLKDDSTTVDKTKETLKEIDKGILVRDTSADIAKYNVLKEKNKITISKAESVKDSKVEHTKTKLVLDEKTAKSIDIDNDGKFGYLRKVDGQVIESKIVTLAELTTGIDATFSDVIIDGFAGSYTKTGSSQNISTNMSLGQSFNSSKTSAMTVNISTTAYSDPYTEIAALNPVAWYKLDNTSGTTIVDSSGHGYNGVAYNGPTWVAGKYNNGMKFDGVNDYAKTSSLSMPPSGTFTAFVRPNSISTPAQQLMGTVGNGTNNRVLLGYYNNKLVASIGAVSGTTTCDYTVKPNIFQMFSVTWNDTTHVSKVYVNGLLIRTLSYSGNGANTNQNFNIGGIIVGETGIYMNATLDNVCVFNDDLSAPELTQLYYDDLAQLQAKTNANATYSGYWNSSSNNPLTLPVSTLDGLISSIQFKVPVNVTQNGINIYYYNQTAAPFTPTASVLFTDDITEITDSHTALLQTVNITHTSIYQADDGSIIPYEILDGYDGTAVLSSNNTNATISRNETAFVISTGYLAAGSTYYYNVEIPVVRASFVNPSATVVVVITAAGAFVGGSFINQWYRKRRNN